MSEHPVAARRRRAAQPRPVRVYDGVTYYDRPAVKHSPWDWKVGAYIFVGGLSGSSQLIATIARATDPDASRGMVRNARFLGAAGAVIGAVLLIIDLKTPHRFYNMLRIFRPTSPMSIGSYILTGFGAFSGLGAVGEVLGPAGGSVGRIAMGLADASQIPAALTGAGLSTYTASLLSSTSTPLWAAASIPLGGHFGASAVASAAAALSLGEQAAGRSDTSASLDTLALLASAADAAFTLAANRRVHARGVHGSVDRPGTGEFGTVALLAVGCVLPMACHLVNKAAGRRSRTLSVLASLGILAGTYIAKASIIRAGNESADRPRDYLRFASPDNLPELDANRAPGAEQRIGVAS